MRLAIRLKILFVGIACLYSALSVAHAEEASTNEDTFLEFLDHEEFIRLPLDRRALYIEVLRDTIVELAESERGSEFEYFNGTDGRYSTNAPGWYQGFVALMRAFAPLAEAQADHFIDSFQPHASKYMTEAEYLQRRQVIENRQHAAGATADPQFKAKQQADLKSLGVLYGSQLAAQTQERDQKLTALESERRLAVKAREERPAVYLPRSGRQFDATKQADIEKINADFEAKKAALLGPQPAPAQQRAKLQALLDSKAELPTQSSAFLKASKLECVASVPSCPNPKTKKGRKIINAAAIPLRKDRFGACIYGGLLSLRAQKTANTETNMRPGNCQSSTRLPIPSLGIIECKKPGQVLCNPMLFGVEDSVANLNLQGSNIAGRCVDRTRTVTSDCAAKLREAQRKKSGQPTEPQFWDLQFPGVREHFDSLASALNDTCKVKEIRTLQCTECQIIQRRLRQTRKIARCKTNKDGEAQESSGTGQVVH